MTTTAVHTTLYAYSEEFESHDLTETDAQVVVVQVLKFFKEFLDQQPWKNVDYVSKRCENVLRREQVVSLGDVKFFLMRAQSNQGVAGAGLLVQDECRRLLKKSVVA